MNVMMNSEQTISERVLAIIQDTIGDSTITLETSTIEPDFDLLDAVECIMNIEDEFDIALDDNVISGLKTVREWCNYVEQKVKEKNNNE